MECSRCRAPNRDGAQFCRACGAPIDVVCAACGAVVQTVGHFCDSCGAALSPSHRGQTSPPRFSSPRSYTPHHLAERILTSRSALEGERKQVTVLFADVTGFTSLSERLDPEDVHGFMNGAFELMMTEVHRYEGTVNQFLGDGIMALFGAPIAHEDHAQRAVHAALGISRQMERYRDELHRERGIVFQVRQGVNTGLVVVGSIGSDLRMDYTAVGDTTNVANRLQQAADPGRVLISETTHRLVEGYFHARPLGGLSMKGKTEAVAAWEVIGAREARTRLEVEADRGLTPFLDREHELDLLFEAFQKAKAGRGQVVFLIGDPGIGKSRLLLEFRRRLGDEATWLEGHALSFGRSMAFHPLIDLLKRNFRVAEGDSEKAIMDKIERGVLRLGDDLRPILPYVRSLFYVDPGDAAVLNMDPKKRRGEIFNAVRRLTVRAAEVRPQVIVFEDAHSMDQAMEEYLDFVADSIPARRILLILTYRTGYGHSFGDRTYHTRIGLTALSPTDTVVMAQSMLAVESLSDELRELIIRKAEGNPFFVEEVVKALREVGVLRPEGSRYVLSRPVDAIMVPDTIQDVIMARIDRLDDEPKKALQLASVIGREFPRRVLDRLWDLPDGIEESVRQLKAGDLIYEKSISPEPTYLFRHALTHEVAYNSLLMQRRRELHRLIGRAIEDLHADRLAEHYEVLAYHFSRGSDRVKALEYAMKAGAKAAGAYANREALALYEQALALAGDDRRARADLLKNLATVTQYLGDADASLQHAESAVDLYEKLGDKGNAVAMHLHIQMLYTWQWDGAREDMGLKHLEAAAALVENEPDSVEKGLVYQRTGHGYLHRSQPVTTLEWAQKAVDMFARLHVPMGTSLGTALAYHGRIDEGIAYSERNWEPVRKAAIPVVMAVMGHELSLVLALARDVTKAAEWGERILPDVVKASPVFESMLWRPLALVYGLSGDVEKGEKTCQAIERIEAETRLGCIYEDAAGLGFLYLRRGEWDKARSYLERAVELYEERSNLSALNGCRLVLGNLHLQTGDLTAAESLLHGSAEMARQGGNVLVELWALPLLCEVYLKTGRSEPAAACLDRAFGLLTPDRAWYGLPAPLFMAKGMCAAGRHDWDEAIPCFERAIAISREHHLPYDTARALYEAGLAQVTRGQAGDRETGRARLTESMEIFQSINAVKDVERVMARKELLST
jgi:class 3 adenylate cyclase/tetratricopeptide (TPR) repeat protein